MTTFERTTFGAVGLLLILGATAWIGAILISPYYFVIPAVILIVMIAFDYLFIRPRKPKTTSSQ